MAKFYGIIGYAMTEETSPGIWEERIFKRHHYGELIRNTRKIQTSESVNDNIDIANEVSILADSFAYGNAYKMRYIEFMGAKWKITSIEIQYPRLILTIGGIYNDQQA